MKSYIMVLHLVLIFLSIGYKEDGNIRPFGKGVEAGAPGVVSEIKVKNILGGAVISYQLPGNPDIMHVRARYKVGQGKEMEARALVYTNELAVDGFGDMNEHEAELSCVDRMGNEGATTAAVATPLKPSVPTTFEPLEVNAIFGGVYVNFENPGKVSLSIRVVATDSLNQPYEAHVQYIRAEKGPLYVHGLKAEEGMFDIYVIDRRGNSSDTLYNVLTSYEGTRSNKKLFYPYILSNDVACSVWGGNLACARNGDYTPALFVHSPGGDTSPTWFTLDMGVTTKPSRYKFYHLFMEEHVFQRDNLKTWEAWGRTDMPPADGSWDRWTKLVDCEFHKPLGLPVKQHTAEDWEYLQAGEDFEFPAEAPPVRYIRFEVLETWGGMDFIHSTELTPWGNVISNN